MTIRKVVHRGLVAVLLMCGCSRPENSEGRDQGVQKWVLAKQPGVNIGTEGDENYQFVEVTAAWKQSDGTIVVVDAGKMSILFFDSTGVFKNQVGGRGAGPGEFRTRPRAWQYRGDSIATYDIGLRRLSVWDPRGNLARSFENPTTARRLPGHILSQSCCKIFGSFSDGSFVSWPPDQIPNMPGADRNATVELTRLEPTGEIGDTLGTFQSTLFRYDPTAANHIVAHAPTSLFQYQVSGDRLTAFYALSPDISRVTRDGRRDSIPVPGFGRPLTPEMKARYEQALKNNYASNPSLYEGPLESYMPKAYSPVAPLYSWLKMSQAGKIWLMRWDPSVAEGGRSQQWDVLGEAGHVESSITFPARVFPYWIGENEVLAVKRDSLDVSSVQLYRIIKDQ